MIKKVVIKRKIGILCIMLISIFFALDKYSTSNANISEDIIYKNESISNNDLLFKRYETGIPLTKNSTLHFNLLPPEYKDAELILVNYSDSSHKKIKHNEKGIFKITKVGTYDVFAMIQNKGKKEFIPVTSHIEIGTEYHIDSCV